MGYLQYNSGDANPVPPDPRTREQTAEWYQREKELEARYFARMAGLLVYVADVLTCDGVGTPIADGDEFLAERAAEWRSVYDALPLETRQTIRAILTTLGCSGLL